MKYCFFGNVDKELVEYFLKTEGPENLDSANPDIVISTERRSFPCDIIVTVEKNKIHVVKANRVSSVFESKPQVYPAVWALTKALIAENKSKEKLTSVSRARRIVSGILQAIVVLLETEDERGYSHSQRVARLVKSVAKTLEFDNERIEYLTECAMLHDVGKIGIEQLMMFSPTRIRVFENMPKDHTIMGAVYLSSIEYLWDVVPAVRSHHEHWDGSGYPDGLKEKEIPFEARLIGLCDYYDELTHLVTSEWGNGPKSHREALDSISNLKGVYFDPALVDAFLKTTKDSDKNI